MGLQLFSPEMAVKRILEDERARLPITQRALDHDALRRLLGQRIDRPVRRDFPKLSELERMRGELHRVLSSAKSLGDSDVLIIAEQLDRLIAIEMRKAELG